MRTSIPLAAAIGITWLTGCAVQPLESHAQVVAEELQGDFVALGGDEVSRRGQDRLPVRHR